MLTFLRSQRALGRRDGPACTRAEADLLRRRVVRARIEQRMVVAVQRDVEDIRVLLEGALRSVACARQSVGIALSYRDARPCSVS